MILTYFIPVFLPITDLIDTALRLIIAGDVFMQAVKTNDLNSTVWESGLNAAQITEEVRGIRNAIAHVQMRQ